MTVRTLPTVRSRGHRVIATALVVLFVLALGSAVSSLRGSSADVAATPAPASHGPGPDGGASARPAAAPQVGSGVRPNSARPNSVRPPSPRPPSPRPNSVRPADERERTSYRIEAAPRTGAGQARPSQATNAPNQATAPSASRSAPNQSQPRGGYRNPSFAYSVLAQLNSERAAHGVPALRMNSQLIASAYGHNLAMARWDQMSHQLPGEAYFSDRISAAGYDYRSAGENIGWNSATSRSAALSLETDMYSEGPPPSGSVNHYSNIVSRSYTDVGIDVYIDTVHGKLWLTEDFGGH